MIRNKHIIFSLFFPLFLIIISACIKQDAVISSVPKSPITSPVGSHEATETLSSAELISPDGFNYYSYRYSLDSNGIGSFTEALLVPLPRSIRESLGANTLYALLQNDGYYKDLVCIPYFALTVTDSTAYVNFERSKTGVPVNVLYSLWATLLLNKTGIEQVVFLEEGQPLSDGYISIPSGYELVAPEQTVVVSDGMLLSFEIVLPDYSIDELRDLRLQVVDKHSTSRARDFSHLISLGLPDYSSDLTLERIFLKVQEVCGWSVPTASFNGIGDADAEFILCAALSNAQYLSWTYENGIYGNGYYSELEPLRQTSQRPNGFLKEYVETAAMYLFGEDVELYHTFAPYYSGYRYDEYSGTYVVLSGGGPRNSNVPFIWSYEEVEKDLIYTAEVSFLTFASAWYDEAMFITSEGEILQPNEVEEYARNQPRHRVVLTKTENEQLIYSAHLLPDG